MFTAVKKLSNLFCLAVLCITIATPATAKDSASKDFTVSYRTDNQIAEDVAHAIRMYPRYDIFDWVEGTVQNGVVTLTGAVREPFHKDEYGKIVAGIPGVTQVHNELRVLPLSTFDDQIRWAAARTIYRDPMFTAYAIQANPPIHVIVENGKVTLKGVVATPMEKQVAETKVRTNVTAFDVTNDLQVEELG
jgi:hyperosmotically inducible periplasmic protein